MAGEDSLVVLAEGLVRLLGALGACGGSLLVLEDLQWVDPETVRTRQTGSGSATR